MPVIKEKKFEDCYSGAYPGKTEQAPDQKTQNISRYAVSFNPVIVGY
jgi:hypothetical protein